MSQAPQPVPTPRQVTPVGKAVIAFLALAVIGGLGYNFRSNLTNLVESHRQQVAITGQPLTQVQGVPASTDTEKNLNVSIVSFSGYAPAILAAGGSLTTQPGSIFDREGVNVKLTIQDDVPTMATLFGSGQAQCSWSTIDQFAEQLPNLRGAGGGLDARAVVVVDNSRGADSIIAGPGINRVEDLVGKKVALLQYTPSHGLLVEAINNSAMTEREKQSIKMVFIQPESGTAAVRAALVSGQVDAAVLWDPDLSLALKAVPNAHTVISTRTISNAIYDVVACDTRFIEKHPALVGGLVRGWLKGVDEANKNPTTAADALVKNEPFFAQLEQQQGKGFTRSLLPNIAFTTVADNARIFGLTGDADGQPTYDRVFTNFDNVYREAGALASPNYPRITPQNSIDLRFIQELVSADPAILAQARKPEFNFTKADAAKAVSSEPVLTKSVSIDFDTGSYLLSPKARHVIDSQLVPLLREAGAAPVRIEGNTDSRGNKDANVSLSRKRAAAVVEYLNDDWGIPANRVVSQGNGSSKPSCDETHPQDSYQTLDGCRAYNRQTHVAIISVK